RFGRSCGRSRLDMNVGHNDLSPNVYGEHAGAQRHAGAQERAKGWMGAAHGIALEGVNMYFNYMNRKFYPAK
ncbi:hypothetical protein, partial [Rhodoblastus acidophilus]|uniref:hypothetical protein n=1 Tax=Rhodoblastus acidophilus TaxID=1074 RepID=UPI001AED008A